MKIDIWSDIMCPFCYIGKRRFEKALEGFPQREQVEIEWHSFQLDPGLNPRPDEDAYTYLARRKGQSRDWSVQVHRQVSEMAAGEGLDYRFDQARVANSFDAHRLIQLAKTHGLGDAAEEALFRAYFTEGADIADQDTLKQLGLKLGLDAAEIDKLWTEESFAAEVLADIEQAAAIGINGVPFFVIDNRYAVSGAQAAETFRRALSQAWQEHRGASRLKPIAGSEGESCGMDGNC